ncbi:MAG: ABC transporter permease, partial [Coriobacteriales bacterium]|nr:ABC transporter permease [Coriobacteriales bacterium]
MSFYDLISETLLSLAANKARSFLTILGIVIGILSVIVMVAIGNGTKASITESIESAGSNLIMVMGGAGAAGADPALELEDAEAIKAEVPGVAGVAPTTGSSFSVVAGSSTTEVNVTGTTVDYPSIRSITVSGGRWFTEGEETAASKVAVIGPTTSESLFGEGSNPVGQRIRIGGQPFTIIGVTESKGASGMTSNDDVIYVPISAVQRTLIGGRGVDSIYVGAASQEQMSQVQQSITDLLLRQHGIDNADDADFQVMSQEDIAQTASTATSLLTVLLGSIAGISLLVGGIGIMNMMLTTVTERIREIGLRKAVGATRSDITSQFLAEAVALTMTGGIIGILGGWGISWAISAFSSLNTSVTPSSVLLAVGVSTAIGLVFGYYPARRA